MQTTRPQPDGALPSAIQIEPSGVCNLRCSMCSARLRDTGAGPAFMDEALFRDIVDQFPSGASLHLQGLGEPMLHASFFEMVSYASDRGMVVSTNSNMTLLNPTTAEDCVRSGLSWIRISIDGATEQTYSSIRVGSSLGRVIENIELVQQAKARLRSTNPRLYLVMVIQKRNIHELSAVVRLAREYGLEQVFVQHLCHDFGEQDASSRYAPMRAYVEAQTLLNAVPGQIARSFQEARALARGLNIGLRLPRINIRPELERLPGSERCDWPWRSLYVSYDGRAMPCCTIGTPDRMTIGDARREKLDRIWNGDAYNHFRSRLDSNDPPGICRSCSLYQGIF